MVFLVKKFTPWPYRIFLGLVGIFFGLYIYNSFFNGASNQKHVSKFKDFPIYYVDLKKNFTCEENEEGSNHNQICQIKGTTSSENRYYLKSYDIHYLNDSLHNISLLNMFDFEYPKMRIWFDSQNLDEYYIVTHHYAGFTPLFIEAKEEDYAVDIVLKGKNKINYLAALFFIGDIHTANLGLKDDKIVIVDYDDWVMKSKSEFAKWGEEFLTEYAFDREYFSFTAGELALVGEKIKALFSNKTKLRKLHAHLDQVYDVCRSEYHDKKIDPYRIIYNHAHNISACLESFKHFKPDLKMTQKHIEKSCLPAAQSKYYNKFNPIHGKQRRFFDFCYKSFDYHFSRQYM